MQNDVCKAMPATSGGTEVMGMNSNRKMDPHAGVKSTFRNVFCSLLATALVIFLAAPVIHAQDDDPFLPAPLVTRTVSTVPSNGDVNPYGIAFVPASIPQGGLLQPFDILVSNFNNNQNLQGTGTTIIRVPQNGSPAMFFQGTAPLGLSTALKVLKAGFVLVGNFPTADGTCATAQPGSILGINGKGQLVSTLTNT